MAKTSRLGRWWRDNEMNDLVGLLAVFTVLPAAVGGVAGAIVALLVR